MALRIIDSIDYLHDFILPKNLPIQKKKSIVLHPVCSLQKMGIENKFLKIASSFSENVTVPRQQAVAVWLATEVFFSLN
jgi:D-lactate dehydrogenase